MPYKSEEFEGLACDVFVMAAAGAADELRSDKDLLRFKPIDLVMEFA